jgi:Fic family protein
MGMEAAMLRTDTLIITPEFLNSIAAIDEFKGAWIALGNLAPERLSRLQRVATIESIGSSTRIEGSRLSDREVEHLLGRIHIRSFATRDEQEVAGYAEVMDLVFESWTSMPLTEGTVRQLHRKLLRYSSKDDWHRGRYKTASNSVAAFDGEGRQVGIVFETAEPFETPRLMGELTGWTNEQLAAQHLHPLIVIGIFVVVFLEIHPFQDGNGRLSRVLTTLLLLQAGYAYVPYSSLESVVEQSKQGYYRALRQTQPTIRTEHPNWQPWLSYFLNAIHTQVKRLRVKAEHEHVLSRKLSALGTQIVDYLHHHERASIGDLVQVTGANRNTIKLQLRKLVESHLVVQHGTGRGTWYSLP